MNAMMNRLVSCVFRMRSPALAIVLLSASVALAATETISATVAGLYVGEQKTVEGKVVAAERDANVVKLHVGDKSPAMTVSLVIELINRFPETPETYYLNRMIRVVGVVERFRGVVEMTVRDPDNIVVVDNRGVVVAGSTGAPVNDLQQRYDALNQRVQQLEQRVHELDKPGQDTAPAEPQSDKGERDE